jgi:hypothetical protein
MTDTNHVATATRQTAEELDTQLFQKAKELYDLVAPTEDEIKMVLEERCHQVRHGGAEEMILANKWFVAMDVLELRRAMAEDDEEDGCVDYSHAPVSDCKDAFANAIHFAVYHDGEWPCVHLLSRLENCSDVMPGDLCSDLDVPAGSTFADGVRKVGTLGASSNERHEVVLAQST